MASLDRSQSYNLCGDSPTRAVPPLPRSSLAWPDTEGSGWPRQTRSDHAGRPARGGRSRLLYSSHNIQQTHLSLKFHACIIHPRARTQVEFNLVQLPVRLQLSARRPENLQNIRHTLGKTSGNTDRLQFVELYKQLYSKTERETELCC